MLRVFISGNRTRQDEPEYAASVYSVKAYSAEGAALIQLCEQG